MSIPKIHVLPDALSLAAAGAELFASLAEVYIKREGRFAVALSGGRTPEAMFHLLAAEPYLSRVRWSAVEIYFSDERCVPPGHADSNFRMARLALLDIAPVEAHNIHHMRGEIEPEAAAREYGQLLKARFGDDGGMDLTLLGMGDDGHTASLFPGTTALAETRHRCVANRVEKLDTWRLTMTAPFINRSRNVAIVVSGQAKAARLREVLQGPRDPERLPIQLVQPQTGTLTWLLDVEAAGMNDGGSTVSFV